MDIDFERLRIDLINYFESAHFAGGIGFAILEADRARYAREEELIRLAEFIGIDLNNYINYKKSRWKSILFVCKKKKYFVIFPFHQWFHVQTHHVF